MTPAPWASVSSFAEAKEAAAGADIARRAACGEALLRQPPSTWREESLRLLLTRALADGDESEAARLAAALPSAVVREERLVLQAGHDPVNALAAAAQFGLSARAWRRLLWTGASTLRDADPMTRDLVAGALCAALEHLPAAVAFLEAVNLARCFADELGVDVFHLMALGTTRGLSDAATADLLLAVGAALAARGATAEAAALNVEAVRLAGP
ncbi:MAG: hypothetical protein JWM82_4227 [Myxococcales bacterium]|nr:hypothetical protein [Myxococcales bacterium]